MRIVLDQERCTGHGRCYTLVPDLFEPDERGHCVVLFEKPPDELVEQAELAVGNCPEHALTLEIP